MSLRVHYTPKNREGLSRDRVWELSRLFTDKFDGYNENRGFMALPLDDDELSFGVEVFHDQSVLDELPSEFEGLVKGPVVADQRPCGNHDCGVSSGIHEGLTFGRGELDTLGFWAVPCDTCARDHERECPEAGPCWPFSDSFDEDEATRQTIAKLLGMQERENGGQGVSCVRAICTFLSAGNRAGAREECEKSGDELRLYPDIVAVLKTNELLSAMFS